MTTGVNEAQRRHWNDERWTSIWPRKERLTETVTPLVLERLGLRPGHRVLDIGSGAGVASLAAARAVGPEGEVVGADISMPLVGLARRRAADEGVANVRFAAADVQHDRVAGGPFDAALSQFGVMFFDDPTAAFGNVRDHLRPGGRLAFACWQDPAKNPWFVGAALADFLPPPPAPLPGRSATGPFAFADCGHVASLLEKAGWSDVVSTPFERDVTVGEEVLVDDDELLFRGVEADRLPEARDVAEQHLAPFRTGDGYLRVPLAVHVLTATA